MYKDQLFDLLKCDTNGNCLRLEGRENRHMRVLTELEVETEEQAAAVVTLGQERRRFVRHTIVLPCSSVYSST